jgi:hypothetical protein
VLWYKINNGCGILNNSADPPPEMPGLRRIKLVVVEIA